jgi:hypothetical protein
MPIAMRPGASSLVSINIQRCADVLIREGGGKKRKVQEGVGERGGQKAKEKNPNRTGGIGDVTIAW